VPGVERTLKARPREHVAYRAGEEIGFEVEPAEVLVFAAPRA
jgi:hypothetical protein